MRRATIPRCIVLGRPLAPACLSLEFRRFGVTAFFVDADMERGNQPLPAGVTPSAAALPGGLEQLNERLLVCDAATFDGDDIGALLADSAADPDDVSARVLITSGATTTPAVAVLRREFLVPGWSLEKILAGAAGAGAPCRTVAGRVPGFGIKRPALFLDRDGTINVDHGYVGSRDRFTWIDGAREAIRIATAAGWHVFVVTNQSGVARGYFDEAAVRALHDWMIDEIRRFGGTVDDVRVCPFHPDGIVPRYRAASDWRKPAPGMIRDLISAWDVDAGASVMVGDQPSDVAAAAAAGIAGYLFPGGFLDHFLAPLLRPFRAATATSHAAD